jgi:hypothetical protein
VRCITIVCADDVNNDGKKNNEGDWSGMRTHRDAIYCRWRHPRPSNSSHSFPFVWCGVFDDLQRDVELEESLVLSELYTFNEARHAAQEQLKEVSSAYVRLAVSLR